MNRISKRMAVFLTVIFLFSTNIAILSAPSSQYANEDYRDKVIYDDYGKTINKPKAQFAANRIQNGEYIISVQSDDGMDINAPFPVLECYVGDTLTFEDLSYDPNGGSIAFWDWQYYGQLGDSYKTYNYNIVNQSSFYLDTPGETLFYLCVKNDATPKEGSCDPWSENGNHQTIGINKWFPEGMYWYFTAIRVIVRPAAEAKVHVRRWDKLKNTVFHEETLTVGKLLGTSATVDTSIHITDWNGYEYHGWSVALPDGTVQYSGTVRDVAVTLASWLPEKYLDIEYISKGEGSGDTTPPTPGVPPAGSAQPSGVCDSEIIWTETDSHQIRDGSDRYGNPRYRTCSHTFTYKATLTVTAEVMPETLKSGYGFEVWLSYDVKITLVSNEGGCTSWGNDRKPTTNVKSPDKATVYIPWTMTNSLGTQHQSIVMEPDEHYQFLLPASPVSETGARRIYTDVHLAGTKEVPVPHAFEIYVSGGGVGNTEFCKKLIKQITINGDMYEDDFSGAD